EDVGVRVAAHGRGRTLEREAAPGVRAPPDDRDAHAGGELGQQRPQLVVELQALLDGEGDRGLVLGGRQRSAARRAEVRPRLVVVPTPRANHPSKGTAAWPLRPGRESWSRRLLLLDEAAAGGGSEQGVDLPRA